MQEFQDTPRGQLIPMPGPGRVGGILGISWGIHVCTVTSSRGRLSGEQGALVAFSAVALPPADSVRVPPMGLRYQSRRIPLEASQPASQPCPGSHLQGLKLTRVPESCTLHRHACMRTHAHTHSHTRTTVIGEG